MFKHSNNYAAHNVGHYRKCPSEVQVITAKAVQCNAEVAAVDDSTACSSPVEQKLLHASAPIAKIFIDDLTERRRQWRVPWFIVLMCLLQISLYIIANDCIYQRLMFIPSHRSECWRYFTYTLLHSDRIHLLLNVCLQCLIGFCLESEQGHWKVAFVYVAGGVSGSLATATFQPQLSLLGASAGVYALLMSHVPHLVKNFRQLPHRYLRVVALAILCVSDAGFSTFHYYVNDNANPRICLEAHVAGGVAGLCLGFLIYRSSHGYGCSDGWSNASVGQYA